MICKYFDGVLLFGSRFLWCSYLKIERGKMAMVYKPDKSTVGLVLVQLNCYLWGSLVWEKGSDQGRS